MVSARRVRRLYLPALDLQSTAPRGLGAGTTKPRAGAMRRDNRETQPGREGRGQPPRHAPALRAGSFPARAPRAPAVTRCGGPRPILDADTWPKTGPPVVSGRCRSRRDHRPEPNRVADGYAPVRRTRNRRLHARSANGRASGASCGLSGTARRALPHAYASTRVRRWRRPANVRPRPRTALATRPPT